MAVKFRSDASRRASHARANLPCRKLYDDYFAADEVGFDYSYVFPASITRVLVVLSVIYPIGFAAGR